MLSQKKLKEIFDYKNGHLIWRKVSNYRNDRIGKKAGCLSKVSGYILVRVNNKLHRASRLIWQWHYGNLKDSDHIDHINGIPTDNRISNLRQCTRSENMRNMKLSKRNKSGRVGVHLSRGKWTAQIRCNNKTIHLGCFTRIEDAIAAREKAEKSFYYHKNHGRIINHR